MENKVRRKILSEMKFEAEKMVISLEVNLEAFDMAIKTEKDKPKKGKSEVEESAGNITRLNEELRKNTSLRNNTMVILEITNKKLGDL